MKILFFVPARGGSKGIKRKNLAPLGGKFLIDYTIEFAKQFSSLGDILLSSDDDEIRDYCATTHAISVDYCRPAELAQDESPMCDAILHSIDWLSSCKGKKYDAICLFQPTSPIRRRDEFLAFLEHFSIDPSRPLVSVVEMKQHPRECITRDENGWRPLVGNYDVVNGRQMYERDFFYIDGTYYMASVDFFKKHKTFLVSDRTDFFRIDRELAVDIDEPIDLELAALALSYEGR